MKELYAVHGAQSIYSIVKANSKEEAFDIFAGNQIDNEIMNEYISRFIVNDGLFESFYQDDKGHLMDSVTGELPERVKQLDENQQDAYVDWWIEKNVHQFWKDEPQFATEYLGEVDKARQSTESYHATFSHDFWVSTIKKVILRGNWYDAFDIVKIDLVNNNYQLIYES